MKKNEYWLATLMTIADLLEAFAAPILVCLAGLYIWLSVTYVWFCPVTVGGLLVWMIVSTFRENLHRVRMNNDA